MSELEVAGAPGGSAQEGLADERASARYEPEPLLRRMLAVGDVLAVATSALVVELWGSGAAAGPLPQRPTKTAAAATARRSAMASIRRRSGSAS